MKNKIFLSFLTYLVGSSLTIAQNNSEYLTQKYFEKNQNNFAKLSEFLQKMPKGGDLHNHHGGASLAENMISYAHEDHLCVDRKTFSVAANPLCAPNDLLASTSQDPILYNSIIDAWSMRHFQPGKETGHDHFFAAFGKYGPILTPHSGEILAELVEHAGEQNESYVELMVTPDNNASGMLGKKLGMGSSFAELRERLLANGLPSIVNDSINSLTADESTLNKTLACGTQEAMPGCHLSVRYLYQVLREQPPEQVFAQLVAGFELASKDKRVVGINIVQPEDGFISMRDYHLHMQMIGYLHKLYPAVHISLHAGELSSSLVPTQGLRFHIRDAIETGFAERIGHGVDVASEDHAVQLLSEMAKKHVMVEINLSSNAAILRIEGKAHPLPLYLLFNVPVALSTDDEGIIRTSLTHEYARAVTTYHFSYATLKKLVRNSLTYSFLPGSSLWKDSDYRQVNAACSKDIVASSKLSPSCSDFLKENEKASHQWDLEKRFVVFENSRWELN